jgi:hypothetical protein
METEKFLELIRSELDRIGAPAYTASENQAIEPEEKYYFINFFLNEKKHDVLSFTIKLEKDQGQNLVNNSINYDVFFNGELSEEAKDMIHSIVNHFILSAIHDGIKNNPNIPESVE